MRRALVRSAALARTGTAMVEGEHEGRIPAQRPRLTALVRNRWTKQIRTLVWSNGMISMRHQ